MPQTISGSRRGLTRVIADRLKVEHGTEDLAEILEVDDRSDLDPAIRRREVFQGDLDTYRDLRKASDGIEHGYLSFGKARALINAVFPQAAAHVRRCILNESGLSAEFLSAMHDDEFDRPLPLWRPVATATGRIEGVGDLDLADTPLQVEIAGRLEVDSYDPEAHQTESRLHRPKR
jgi:hypothetical protein